jgi:hypothetical protein
MPEISHVRRSSGALSDGGTYRSGGRGANSARRLGGSRSVIAAWVGTRFLKHALKSKDGAPMRATVVNCGPADVDGEWSKGCQASASQNFGYIAALPSLRQNFGRVFASHLFRRRAATPRSTRREIKLKSDVHSMPLSAIRTVSKGQVSSGILSPD